MVTGCYFANGNCVPFDWGVLANDWTRTVDGVRRGGRPWGIWPVLRDGRVIIAEVPTGRGTARRPFDAVDPVFAVWWQYRRGGARALGPGGECVNGAPSERPRGWRAGLHDWWPATREAYRRLRAEFETGVPDPTEFGVAHRMVMTREEVRVFHQSWLDAARGRWSVWCPLYVEDGLHHALYSIDWAGDGL